MAFAPALLLFQDGIATKRTLGTGGSAATADVALTEGAVDLIAELDLAADTSYNIVPRSGSLELLPVSDPPRRGSQMLGQPVTPETTVTYSDAADKIWCWPTDYGHATVIVTVGR